MHLKHSYSEVLLHILTSHVRVVSLLALLKYHVGCNALEVDSNYIGEGKGYINSDLKVEKSNVYFT